MWMYYPAGPIQLVARIIFAPAVLIDLISIYLDVTYLLRKGGQHGIGLISLVAYAVFLLFGVEWDWWWRLPAMACLTVFYYYCHGPICSRIMRRLGWTPQDAYQPRDWPKND